MKLMDKEERRRQLQVADDQVLQEVERARSEYRKHGTIPAASLRLDVLTHFHAWAQEFGNFPVWYEAGLLLQIWALESELRERPEVSGLEAMATLDRDLVRYYAVLDVTELVHPCGSGEPRAYSQVDAIAIVTRLLRENEHPAARSVNGGEPVGEDAIRASFKRMRKLDRTGRLPVSGPALDMVSMPFVEIEPERIADLASKLDPGKYPASTQGPDRA